MIKFFRRIRQRLLSNNKFSKYLIYAVGEIVLVVIGILLALQINNWNIKQVNLEKEKNYLTEIKKNLESDLLKIDRVFAFNKMKTEKISECIQLFGSPNAQTNAAQIIGQRVSTLGSYELFAPNDLGFKNLMSASNIDLIQNHNLRQLLLEFYSYNFYSGTQKRAEELTRKFVDYTAPLITTKEYYNMVYQVDLDIQSNMDSKVYKDTQVLSYLDLMKVVTSLQNELLKTKVTEINELIKAVDQELTN